MTEAGNKWVDEREKLAADERDWEIVHALSRRSAEFWLRAFCGAVEQRAQALALAHSHGVPHDPNFVDYSEAFDELKREFLEEP